MSRQDDPKYVAWADAVKHRDGYRCATCGKRDWGAHAHHKKAWAIYPELRYDLDNGVTLCRRCHGTVEGVDYLDESTEKYEEQIGWVFECDVCGQTRSQRRRAGGDKIPADENYSVCESCFTAEY